MNDKSIIVTSLLIAFTIFKLNAASYFVAIDGDNNNNGSSSLPWQTIQFAVNNANAGDEVIVRPGIYNESIVINQSGNSSGYISIKAESGAILDGTDQEEIGFTIKSQSYIKIIGFEIRNFTSSDVPMGLFIGGDSDNIEIRNNLIHHIATSNTSRGNAHGIAVYGNQSSPIDNIIIDENEIHNCILGWSESLVINGNVTNFVVSNNSVHDNNNIGIDIIGHEGTGPKGQDQARQGVVIGNHVYNISSGKNPVYRGESCADGIYVDGGKDIIIEQNTIDNCDVGIELASEHLAKNTENIIIRNNFVSRSLQGNIQIGGYDAKRGNSVNITIVNNTTFHSNSAELVVQFYTKSMKISNNIFVAKPGKEYLSEWGSNNTDIIANNNIYFGSSTTETGSWNDKQAFFIDPKLEDLYQDLHLKSSSPAINNGIELSPDIVGTVDIDGNNRINDCIDQGAHEYSSSKPVN